MGDSDDMDLVGRYAAGNADDAFAELVRRYINLVYSVALRRLGNPHQAEEVTQAVFIILARKAASLRPGTILPGWLYQTAQLTAANFQRSTLRRQRLEQEALMQFVQDSQTDVSLAASPTAPSRKPWAASAKRSATPSSCASSRTSPSAKSPPRSK